VIVNFVAEHRDDVRPISRYFETNVQGAKSVCEVARTENVRKIVFTSSAAVYGFTPTPAKEEGPFRPFNSYGETKLQAEGVYRSWADEDPSRTLVIVRPTVIFGEGNRGNVYNLLRQIASRRFLMVGRGDNFKSMAYVENVAAFIAYSLSFGPGIHVFNYADLPDMTTRELANHVLKCMGRPSKLRSLPRPIAMTAGHLFDLVARVSGRRFPISAIRIQKFCENTQLRADRVLRTGFVPPYSLLQGLERTIRSEFSSTTKND
jgi:nucleoside-diphosphate-sugar epimerase